MEKKRHPPMKYDVRHSNENKKITHENERKFDYSLCLFFIIIRSR